MSVTPQISLIAFEGRDPARVFVKVPNERGRWVLTDRCVVEVPCSHCKSAIGEPCKRTLSHDGYGVGTHFVRRNAWMRKSTKSSRREIQIEDPKPRIRVHAGSDLRGEVIQ